MDQIKITSESNKENQLHYLNMRVCSGWIKNMLVMLLSIWITYSFFINKACHTETIHCIL